jgi:hypothetical protein
MQQSSNKSKARPFKSKILPSAVMIFWIKIFEFTDAVHGYRKRNPVSSPKSPRGRTPYERAPGIKFMN